MKKILFAIALLAVVGCTNPQAAKETLEAEGYTNVVITGYDWYACSKDDMYHTGFTATTPAGKCVKGTACTGFLFRGTTLRFKGKCN